MVLNGNTKKIKEQMDSILYLTKLKRELSNKKGYGL